MGKESKKGGIKYETESLLDTIPSQKNSPKGFGLMVTELVPHHFG